MVTCVMFESKGGPGWWLTPEASGTSVSSARRNSSEAWEGPFITKLLLQKPSNTSIQSEQDLVVALRNLKVLFKMLFVRADALSREK